MYQPVIIIGAARSGTNLLRDLLTRLKGVGTWPCDEINAIWRHGNTFQPSDELDASLATPRIRAFIRGEFDRLARRRRLGWVVEKTCANSLRVGFVERVLPDAKYIFLVRDGRDVTASALRRWSAPLDLPYLLRKSRYVPFSDVPIYATRTVVNRAYRMLGSGNRLAFWGPRFDGMEQLLKTKSLPEVCATQWTRSVAISRYELSRIPSERICSVKYEDFVNCPAEELQRLLEFMDIFPSSREIEQLTSGVTAASVGNWRRQLPRPTLQQIEPIMHRELTRFGYEPATAWQPAVTETVAFPTPNLPLRRAA